MASWQMRRFSQGGVNRSVRIVLTGVAVFGMGVVAYLVRDLAMLARASDPRPVLRDSGGEGGALVICGGGRLPDEVRRRFVELAGGPRAKIVVIPTAHPSADTSQAANALEVWKALGVAAVNLLHTRSRQTANDPTFLQPLTEATGVWLGGGRQEMLTNVYVGTEVERELKRLLERGGVIGGSSAGAAAMTRVMIAGGRTEASEGRGFDLLPDSVVDQHFMKRNRIERLLGLLARHPGLVGFGIDERTALVVRGHQLSVIGDSYVMACVPASPGHEKRLEFLKRGDSADLDQLKGPDVAITTSVDLDEALLSNAGH